MRRGMKIQLLDNDVLFSKSPYYLIRDIHLDIGIFRDLLLVLLTLVLGRGILVLLVFRDEIVHVGRGLRELHLVLFFFYDREGIGKTLATGQNPLFLSRLGTYHSLASVPMQESLATEHGHELIADALEQLLDGS